MLGNRGRIDDMPPYRAMGPVTTEEYESRAERFDKQLKEEVGFDPRGKSTEEKMKALREYRYEHYSKVVDAAYDRRGWTRNGIPKLERLKQLGIDLPELIGIVKDLQE